MQRNKREADASWKNRVPRRGPIGRFIHHWLTLFTLVRGVLKPSQLFVIGASHIVLLAVERLLNHLGVHTFGTFPKRIDPPSWRRVRGTVVLAPGLGQSPFSCYPFGLFLAYVFGLRVLFLQTHEDGNVETFERMVVRNQWILHETGNEPLVGIGFSKGALDLVWLFAPIVYNNTRGEGTRRLALASMSAPLRGTVVASAVRTPGASMLAKDAREIERTLSMVQALRDGGVRMRFYCAIWGDFIVRRSDTRPINVERYRPPTLLERLLGKGGEPPWYWSMVLWAQIGHTAIYNPFAWYQVGRCVTRDLLPRL